MVRRLDPRNVEVVDDRVAEILRRKTPAERLAIMFDCDRFVRMMIAGVLKADHADWTEARVQAEVARRIAGGSE